MRHIAYCGAACAASNLPEYSETLHIGGVFIILGTSFLGTILPLVINRYWKGVPRIIISCGKLFGAGVILATGFIHMFPSSDQASAPCELPLTRPGAD